MPFQVMWQITTILSSSGFACFVCMASLRFSTTANPHLLYKSTKTKPKKLQQNAKSISSLVSHDSSEYFHQISSLSKQGRVREAVDLFTQMELRSLGAQPENYGELLQGCVYERDLSLGRQIHARIVKNGDWLARDEYIETKLVIFYAKCDVRCVASRMFHSAGAKNVFSWAAIIGMECRMGFCEEALLGFREMMESGFLPDNYVVPNALKACGALQWIGIGKGIHGYVVKMGFCECVFVTSSLVDMYGKCGGLGDARKTFDGMPERNAVTWNSLIVGYVQNGMNEEAMKVFYEMRMEGVGPTHVTLSGFLSASANVGAIEEGKQGHAVAVLEGIVLNTVLGSSIINFYSKVGLVEDAELVFHRMLEKDVVTWNLIVSGYVQIGNIDKALSMCCQMRLQKLRFDSVTLASLISASADTANLKLGKAGHCYCIRNDLDSDVVVASSIVNMYAKCNGIDCARQVFDSVTKGDLVLWNTMLAAYAELGQSGEALKLFYQMQLEGVPPNVISWNSVILGFLKNGQVDEAKDMFLQMLSLNIAPNLVTWTSLISGLAENGFGYEAISVFQQMQEVGIKPNSVSIVSVLSACVNMALLQYGRAIHGYVMRHFLCLSVPLATSFVDMYAKCGNLDEAMKVFDTFQGKEVPIYNAMIAGYALHGQAMEALALYRRLEGEGKKPDSITFTNALYACSHSGLVDEGLELFVDMVSKHDLKPNIVHYGCMVNLLSRCGNLDGAFRLITSMPYEPDAHIFGSLLAACRENNEIELAEYLSQKLMKLEPNNSGNYVALSNAYAAAGKWDNVENVRHVLKEKGLAKIPGCSWIQIGEVFHVFVAGDKSHPKTEQIYLTLALLRLEVCSLKFSPQQI